MTYQSAHHQLKSDAAPETLGRTTLGIDAGKSARCTPRTVTPQHYEMLHRRRLQVCRSLSFTESPWEPNSRQPRNGAGAKWSDRSSSPSRPRSVRSMKQPIPLVLGDLRPAIELDEAQYLRRSRSFPAQFGETIEAEAEDYSTAESPRTRPHSSDQCTMQASANIASPHTLSDLGIFGVQDKSHCRSSFNTRQDEQESRSSWISLDRKGSSHGTDESQADHSTEAGRQTQVQERNSSGLERPTALLGWLEPATSVGTSPSGLGEYSSDSSWLEDPSDNEDGQYVRSVHGTSSTETSPILKSEESNSGFHTENMYESTIEYATALSPSRPSLVEVRSKRSSISSTESPRSLTFSHGTSYGPSGSSYVAAITPPPSPSRLASTSLRFGPAMPPHPGNMSRDMIVTDDADRGILTPPNTPEKTGNPSSGLSPSLGGVFSMLEQALASFPGEVLQMSSPVITSVRAQRELQMSPQPSSSSLDPGPDLSIANRPPKPTHQVSPYHLGVKTNKETKMRYFYELFDTQSDALTSGIYAHVLVLDFLTNLVSHLQGRATHPASDTISVASTETLSKVASVALSDDSPGSLTRTVQVLTRGVKACLSRLIESTVGLDGSNEMTLRLLTTVVRLIEEEP